MIPNRLLRLVLMVSLVKLIGAAFWPVSGEEALLWANVQSGAPLAQADAISAFIARLMVDTGPLQLLMLRLPGILASTVVLLPLVALTKMLGRNWKVACSTWLVLQFLPGVLLGSFGWNREALLLLVWVSAAAAGMAGARGSRSGATLLGWISGLSFLIHPLAPLCAACSLAWPMEKDGSTPAAPRWRVLQGLLPAVLLVGLINGEASLGRVLHFSSSLGIGLDISALGLFTIDALMWTGFAFLFLIMRSWSELRRKQVQGALTLRLAAVAPLIVLSYLGCQGPLDGRLALGPLIVAFLPGLLSPDLPTSLRRKLTRVSGTVALGLMGIALAATWIPALGVPLAELAPKCIERSPAARPTTRAMLADLKTRVPQGTSIAGNDPLQAAMFSFLEPYFGPPIDIEWTHPLPAMVLLLLDRPDYLPATTGPYSTAEMLPSVRVKIQGREDQVLVIALARDPQSTSPEL